MSKRSTDPSRRHTQTALVTGAFAVFAWAWGCNSAPSTTAPSVVIAPVDGGTVMLAPGSTLELSLDANPTTGFSWQLDEIPTGLALTGEPTYVAINDVPGGTLRTGAGGTQRWRFKVDAAAKDGDHGDGTLRLSYRRPWEKDVAPAKTYTANVQITAK